MPSGDATQIKYIGYIILTVQKNYKRIRKVESWNMNFAQTKDPLSKCHIIVNSSSLDILVNISSASRADTHGFK